MSDFFGALVDAGSNAYAQYAQDERQDDAQNFNQQEALAQRDWEERMSNTRYQRTATDLGMAGFNPMLAYTNGPGNTPQGSAASSSPSGAPGQHSIAASMQSASQAKLNEELEKKAAAETDRTQAEADEIRARTPTHEVTRDSLQQNIKESEERINNIIQQVKTGVASAANIEQQTRNLKELIPQIHATVNQLKSLSTLQGAQTGLAKAHTQQSGAETGRIVTETGHIQQQVNANLPELQKAVGELERQAKALEMGGREMQADIDNSYVGALSRVMKALVPFNAIIPTVPISGTGATKPTEDRKWPRKR